MKGYKGMNPDMTCRGFQYEIGKTYKMEGEISLCKRGFHFCKRLEDVFGYYELECENPYLFYDDTTLICGRKELSWRKPTISCNNRFFKIEASGEIINGRNKCVSSEITIVKELNYFEILRCIYGGGYGNGYGYGNGFGYGNGNGFGGRYGDGFGDGWAYGDGNGAGHGHGVNHGYEDRDWDESTCGERVFQFI